MTTKEAMLIEKCRREGMGAKLISGKLGLPLNTVKSYLRRHPVSSGAQQCLQCQRIIRQPPQTRVKKFCSDKCRLVWWHEHPEQLQRTTKERLCEYCGQPFTTHKKKQRFCCRNCYAASMRKGDKDNVS